MNKPSSGVALFFFLAAAAFGGDAKILTNHVGYEASGPKRAVILGRAGDVVTGFAVLDAASGRAVLSSRAREAGAVRNWKDWRFWTVDFGGVAAEGTYVLEVEVNGRRIRSQPFAVSKNALERHTLSDVVYYFKGQRSSGLLDKADRTMTFEGERKGTVDVHGGWFDASGDYGKHLSHLSFSTYFNPQQIPLAAWSLGRAYLELERRQDPDFRQYLRRLLDEALFGADYLVRIKNPAGSFYRTVSGKGPEKKPEDRRITPDVSNFSIRTPETKDAFDQKWKPVSGDFTYEVGFRAGGGVSIAALAAAARFGAGGDFAPADYLNAAENAFAFLEKHNLEFANDGRENIVDDTCALLAAAELFRTTGREAYRAAADKRASSLMARLTSDGGYRDYWRADDGRRPFFHPVDAGLPVVSLLVYAEVAPGDMKSRILETVRRSLEFELDITAEVNNPFGYSRQLVQNKAGVRRTAFFFPHDTETAPWWQGENARLGSMAAAARMGARAFRDDAAFAGRLRAFAADQLNWILGLNPFDTCMLYGRGRNNPEYMFFNSYEYTNAPGGISNGITAGLTDDLDIDYNLGFAQTGKDDDWRWTEQWLPHAAWYLLAVACGSGE